jgi:dipeptide/tripeptide permease
MLYGDVFAKIALAAILSSAVCFALVPLLKRWMHPDVPAGGD